MNEELKNLIIIKTILMSSSIELKGEAIIKVASTLSWLEERIAELKNGNESK